MWDKCALLKLIFLYYNWTTINPSNTKNPLKKKHHAIRDVQLWDYKSKSASLNITKQFFLFPYSKKINFAKDVSEKMEKLTATLEKERQTYQETMAWANKHCSQMDQKIKALESQLLQSQIVILDSVEKDETRHQNLQKSPPVILDSVESEGCKMGILFMQT